MDVLTVALLIGGLAAGGAGCLAARRAPGERAAPRSDPEGRQAGRLADVGQLVSGLMHEIKNPLSTLNLNLQLLAEDFQQPRTDAERRAARKIEVLREETQRLAEVLEKFTALVGRMELAKTALDPGQLVADLLAFYEPQAAAGRITLRAAVADGLPLVMADADLLKQALLNLILNAQTAMPEGGELIISVHPDGPDVAITVTDTGCGIPADRLDRVFDAYYSTRPGGSGMGLAIVKRIVDEHAGTVNVTSEPGRGTQFTLRLPAAAADTGEARP